MTHAKETSRCSGHCCRGFPLPGVSPHWLLTTRGDPEYLFIADMLVNPRWVPFGDMLPEGVLSSGIWIWDCRHQDSVTGNCTVYEQRPALCRNHPGHDRYAGACIRRECTRRTVREEQP